MYFRTKDDIYIDAENNSVSFNPGSDFDVRPNCWFTEGVFIVITKKTRGLFGFGFETIYANIIVPGYYHYLEAKLTDLNVTQLFGKDQLDEITKDELLTNLNQTTVFDCYCEDERCYIHENYSNRCDCHELHGQLMEKSEKINIGIKRKRLETNSESESESKSGTKSEPIATVIVEDNKIVKTI